jgi:hypothetical protein
MRPQRASTRGPIPEQAGYWLILLGVYVLVGVLFFYSGKGKLFDDNGDAPPALKKQFQGTFVDKVPGVNAAWVIIGVLELAIVALIIISLLQREFLPSRTKSVLTAALAHTSSLIERASARAQRPRRRGPTGPRAARRRPPARPRAPPAFRHGDRVDRRFAHALRLRGTLASPALSPCSRAPSPCGHALGRPAGRSGCP